MSATHQSTSDSRPLLGARLPTPQTPLGSSQRALSVSPHPVAVHSQSLNESSTTESSSTPKISSHPAKPTASAVELYTPNTSPECGVAMRYGPFSTANVFWMLSSPEYDAGGTTRAAWPRNGVTLCVLSALVWLKGYRTVVSRLTVRQFRFSSPCLPGTDASSTRWCTEQRSWHEWNRE